MLVGVAGLLALVLLAEAPVQGPDVRVALTGPPRAAAGSTVILNVLLHIPEGYHVQADTVAAPNIPTQIALKVPRGFRAGKPVFPKPVRGEAAGQILDLFEGRVVVRVPVRIPAGARGPAAITATVTYQACDATSCYPPSEATATLRLAVAGKR